ELVRPRTPLRLRGRAMGDAVRLAAMVRDVAELSAIVSDIEPDGKGIPVLLRQYLRLGARTLALNVDERFGNCLDCLCVVDLASADRRAIGKYFGKEEAAAYYERIDHGDGRDGTA